MAHSKEDLFKRAVDILENDQELVFIEELAIEMGISKTTLYKYFKDGSDELDVIKGLILDNKASLKKKLRNKWYNSDNATLNVCAYKLLSNSLERDLLADRSKNDNANANIEVKDEKYIKGVLDKLNESW